MSKCKEWQGNRNAQGYGRYGKYGQRVHRLAWEAYFGDIPEGMCVLHRCDNPACYNHEHLFLGTRSDNAADKVAKGRQASGGDIGYPESMRNQARMMEGTQREIAAALGVTQQTVSRWLRG